MYCLLNLYQEYSDYSTIAGLLYIFMPDQTLFGKLYWIIAILLVSSFYIFTFFAHSQLCFICFAVPARNKKRFCTVNSIYENTNRTLKIEKNNN